MTSDLDIPGRSSGDQARSRAYVREFVPAMAGYVLALFLALRLGHLDGSSGWRFVWAVLPLLPLAGVAVAVVRHLRRLDDYQQRLLRGSFGAGFAAALAAALTLGFLSMAGLNLHATPWIIFGVGMGGWALAAAVGARR